jgi:hypothetical protein
MATNPLAPDPVTDIDGPEVHQHEVPIVNIEDEDGDRESLEYEPEDDHGEPPLVPDEA